MKVLVTGSSGFIGQALVRRLKAAGWEVAGLDKGAGAPSKYLCDILDAARLTESVQHCSPRGAYRPRRKGHARGLRRQHRWRAKPDRRGSFHAFDQASDLDFVAARLPRRLCPARRYRLHRRYALWPQQDPHRTNRPRTGRRRTRLVPGPSDDGMGARHEPALPTVSSNDPARTLLPCRTRSAVEVL
jgi:NAD dependent epimerase/dehydratase family